MISVTKILKTHVGKHNHVPDKNINTHELKLGEKIEHEHTNNNKIARAIAKDHIAEIPDYYERLSKMESNAKKEQSK